MLLKIYFDYYRFPEVKLNDNNMKKKAKTQWTYV